MKKGLWLIVMMLALFGLAACDSAQTGEGEVSGDISEIVESGTLKVGVKTDVKGFSYKNPDTGELEGIEIDLARMIAQDLLGDGDAIAFKEVTEQQRGPMLENDQVDMVIATFTITDERRESFNFSEPYYTDKIGFLVKAESELSTFADFAEHKIGIVKTTTTRSELEKYAAEMGIAVEIVEFEAYPEIKAALEAGEVDAISTDRSILLGYEDESTRLLEDGFADQDYGVATKLSKAELSEYVSVKIAEWRENGTLSDLIIEWEL